MDTSHDLLVLARDGDDRARNGFCERYRVPLARWARGRLPRWARERIDTEDIVQDVLIGTIRNLERFRERRPGAIESYLRQAVDNRVRDEVRRTRLNLGGHVESGVDEPVDDGPSPLLEAIDRQRFESFERALSLLTDEVRGLVFARFDLRKSYAEIAAEFGKPSADAARMAVGRALVALAGAMVNGA
ncbi:MAG TPA: sigma-70 family RNA polymerase sigma factor [Candidatus Polarisedimenticolaceae bacterium]|nr:sigma-70 family RNA polymerase sigma factor [Candidatus Polarisedimenticolaceae bacterium]